MTRRGDTSRDARRATLGIVPALQELTDGVMTLFLQHLTLFRVELKEDASIIGRYVGAIVFFAAIAFMGFGLLAIATILFAGWAFGIGGMAVMALILAITLAGFGGISVRHVLLRMQEDALGPANAGQELELSKEWAKKIPHKPAES